MTCIKCPPLKTVCPPKVIAVDVFDPQPVAVIQPIEIITRHHCVPVPFVVPTLAVKKVFVPGPGGVVHGVGGVAVAGAQGNKRKRGSSKK